MKRTGQISKKLKQHGIYTGHGQSELTSFVKMLNKAGVVFSVKFKGKPGPRQSVLIEGSGTRYYPVTAYWWFRFVCGNLIDQGTGDRNDDSDFASGSLEEPEWFSNYKSHLSNGCCFNEHLAT